MAQDTHAQNLALNDRTIEVAVTHDEFNPGNDLVTSNCVNGEPEIRKRVLGPETSTQQVRLDRHRKQTGRDGPPLGAENQSQTHGVTDAIPNKIDTPVSRRSVLGYLGAGATLPLLSSTGRATTVKTQSGFPDVTAMTFNVYVGFDVRELFAVDDPDELPEVAGQLYQDFLATDFPTRADAIVAQIAKTTPDVVGLQEVLLLRRQQPSDFDDDPTPNATTVDTDFLVELESALDDRGLAYSVANVSENFDIEVPALIDGDLVDIRGTDRDIILAREGVPTSNSKSTNFASNLTRVLAGNLIELTRGYGTVDTTIGGTLFRFANTHLEPFNQGIRVAQASELLGDLTKTRGPIVLVGDFNTTPGATTYELVTDQFTDAWSEARADSGFTCCQASDLRNPASSLDRRIDFVLFREDGVAASANRVGDADADKTPTGLWPSDHAGVVATLKG